MVYIILVNWNNFHDTIKCLSSLRCLLNAVETRILVCDNFSTDDSVSKINEYSKSFNDVQIVKNYSNLGFAAGCNLGMSFALSDPRMKYVWLLNNDTVVEENSLTEMIEIISDNPKIGICGSILLYEHKRDIIQSVGGRYNSWLGLSSNVLANKKYVPDIFDNFNLRNIDYVVGASMLVTRSFIENVGLMDERYFLYCEDLDWATRAKQAGYELGVATKSFVYHKEGATTKSSSHMRRVMRSGLSDYYALRSHLHYAHKFSPSLKFRIVRSFCLIKSLKRLIQFDFEGAKRSLHFFIYGLN